MTQRRQILVGASATAISAGLAHALGCELQPPARAAHSPSPARSAVGSGRATSAPSGRPASSSAGSGTVSARGDDEGSGADAANPRMPAIYLPHGGGPWPWIRDGMFGADRGLAELRAYLEALPGQLPAPPKAVLVVTAHWEESRPTLSGAARPPMLYDYGGFPPHTYEIQWPAPGDPELAASIRDELSAAGFEAAIDQRRGFDHGTFVPMAVAWPGAEVPTVQLSLIRGLDPRRHLELGRALQPLRDRGVLILGSGMSYHNMRGFGTAAGARDALEFDAWLHALTEGSAEERTEALAHWERAPRAQAVHPREEHLLPLMVVAGAAGDAGARITFSAPVLGTQVSALHFA